VAALRRQHETINHAALDMLCALMQPMHSNYELRQEQMNKNALLASESFLEHLLEMGVAHMASDTGALVIASLLDLLTYALCAPYSETTAGDRFDTLLNMVASRGRVFYRLFQHPCTTIVKGAGMVMRAIIEESDETTSRRMQVRALCLVNDILCTVAQALALSDGALLRHLHTAVFTQSKDVRLLTQRQLSRHLLSLWCAGNVQAHQLLQRCLVGTVTFPRSCSHQIVS
jgi:DnaJ family protein C protein 13